MTPADEKTIVSIAKVKANRVAAYNRATYGAVIRASRLRKGLSQPQLAKILNTSKNYVSNWEIGKARPDMNMVPALCKALDISIAELFGVRGEYDTLSPTATGFVAVPASRRIFPFSTAGNGAHASSAESR